MHIAFGYTCQNMVCLDIWLGKSACGSQSCLYVCSLSYNVHVIIKISNLKPFLSHPLAVAVVTSKIFGIGILYYARYYMTCL